MNNKTKNVQTKFANAAGMFASRLSLSPIAGQIYGLLYMSPEPVSLNEMVDKLNISKGSASTNVRALESWGAVKKVWVDNSRRDYYQANPDTISIFLSRLKEGLSRRLKDQKKELDSIEEIVYKEQKTSEEKDFYEKRLNRAKEMYKQAMQFIHLLTDNADIG